MRVGCGIADSDIVNFIDDANAEEVRPDAVHEVTGEVGVLRGSEPLCDDFASVLPARDFRLNASQKDRNGVLPGDRMRDFPATAIEDDLFPIVFAALPSNLGEECGEVVIIVLGPAVERMVVALGALNAHPHEDLRHVFRDFQLIAFDFVEVGLGRCKCSAAGREQVSSHDVEWDVTGNLLTEPLIIQDDRLVRDLVTGSHHEPLGPLGDPEFCEFLACKEFVDLDRALVRRCIRHKGFILFHRRQLTNEVQRDASQEFFVGALLRWMQANPLKFGGDEFINVIDGLEGELLVLQTLRKHQVLGTDGVSGEASHHVGFPAGAGSYEAIIGDHG